MLQHVSKLHCSSRLRDTPWYAPCFVYPFTCGWTWGGFCILAAVTNAALNSGVQVRVCSCPQCSLGYTEKWNRWIAHSSSFNFLRNRRPLLHGGCSVLHSHQLCASAPVPPHPCRRLVFSGFVSFCLWMIAVFMGVERCVIVVLIGVSPATSDAGHLFRCILDTCRSS